MEGGHVPNPNTVLKICLSLKDATYEETLVLFFIGILSYYFDSRSAYYEMLLAIKVKGQYRNADPEIRHNAIQKVFKRYRRKIKSSN